MTSEIVVSIAERAIWVILMASGPLLIVALLTGLAVSIFQATTQIQEQTLAFVPKIIAVLVAIIFFGPWMLSNSYDVCNRDIRKSSSVYWVITMEELIPAWSGLFTHINTSDRFFCYISSLFI